MYNRYIPQPDGSYRKKVETEGFSEPEIPLPPIPEPLPIAPAKTSEVSPLSSLTNGDLMTLLSMLLIASEGDEHRTTALLTLVFYFLT